MAQARSIITVGNFDSVHAGHQALLARAEAMAKTHRASRGVVVLSFDPHPMSVLMPEQAPPQLTTFPHRVELLKAAGASEVHRLEPTDELLNMSPERFVRWVVDHFAPIGWIEGPDFRFGHGRAGSIETLRELANAQDESRRFVVETLTPLAAGLMDNTVVTVSSTMVRWLLERGRVRDVWNLLSRPYALTGQVVRGDRRGRTLNFPTANLGPMVCDGSTHPLTMLPADGVYAALATLPDGSRSLAALSVGTKPQFNTTHTTRTAEAYLLDVTTEPGRPNLPNLPEYGWELSLDLLGWVRSQMRFASVELLLEQMTRDCQRVRSIADHIIPSTCNRPIVHAPSDLSSHCP